VADQGIQAPVQVSKRFWNAGDPFDEPTLRSL
jgi:hypothetical protein